MGYCRVLRFGSAIAEISGLALPAGAKVRFVEQLEEQVFVLPSGDEELSDEELEHVAAGGSARIKR